MELGGRAARAAAAVGLAAAAVAAGGSAGAFVRDYNPLTAAELARRVPMWAEQRRCGPGFLPRVGPRGVLLGVEDEGLVVTGVDRAGAPFRVELRAFALGCATWSADLDGDGALDLVVVGATGGTGLAPPRRLAALLFDGAGRPVPWEVDGFFEVDELGVRDMLDLDGDGRGELVRMSFDDGYWATAPYEAEAARFHLRVGEHGGRVFPLYTRFTRRPNRVPSAPSPDRSPFVGDLSNAVPQAAGPARISALGWADPPLSEGPLLLLSDGRLCAPGAGETTVTVVVDRRGRRDAAVLGVGSRARRLLEEATLLQLPVLVAGRRSDQGCTPELVWAYAP